MKLHLVLFDSFLNVFNNNQVFNISVSLFYIFQKLSLERSEFILKIETVFYAI